MHKDTETFQVSSLQEAEDFATYVSRYGDSTSLGYDIRDHIRNIYNYSRFHSTSDRINGKLLNAYIDLELTYFEFMMKDSLPTGAVAHHDGVRILVQGIGEVCEKQVHDWREVHIIDCTIQERLRWGQCSTTSICSPGKWIFYIPCQLFRSDFARFGISTWERCFCSMKIKNMRNTSRLEGERHSLFDTPRNGRIFLFICEGA